MNPVYTECPQASPDTVKLVSMKLEGLKNKMCVFSDYSETEFKVRNRKLSEKNKTLIFF